MNKIIGVCLLFLFISSAFGQDSYHVVKKGETLYGISRTYDIDIQLIKDANDIKDPATLQIGQKLIIPSSYKHIVKKGETLFRISMIYNIKLDVLYELNNLNSDSTIYEGQVIILPKEAFSDVKSSDNSSEPVSLNAESTSLIWPHPGTREKTDDKLNGITISANKGDEFFSISSGKVLFCRLVRGYGYTITILTGDHYMFVYGGIDKTYVEQGQIVDPGTKLGTIRGDTHNGESKLTFYVLKKEGNSWDAIDPSLAPRG